MRFIASAVPIDTPEITHESRGTLLRETPTTSRPECRTTTASETEGAQGALRSHRTSPAPLRGSSARRQYRSEPVTRPEPGFTHQRCDGNHRDTKRSEYRRRHRSRHNGAARERARTEHQPDRVHRSVGRALR